jgi:hypothetical protein
MPMKIVDALIHVVIGAWLAVPVVIAVGGLNILNMEPLRTWLIVVSVAGFVALAVKAAS